MGKAICGGVVSVCFATALTFTPLPDWLRLPVLFCVWTCIPLGILGYFYAHFKEKIRYHKGGGGTPAPAFPYSGYREDIYQEILWTWDFNNRGQIINLVARCPKDDCHSPVTIYATGRQLDMSGQPFRGYRVVCPSCPDKIVATEPLSHYMSLDRSRPPQADLYSLACAYIEGKIHSGRYALTGSERPSAKLRIQIDEEHPFDGNVNGAIYWRVDVISSSDDPIIDCTAYLTKIERNGIEKWAAKKVPLTFEPGEAPDSTCKTINPRAKEILDIFATSDGALIPATWPRAYWPYREQLHTIFEQKGRYTFTVSIEAKNLPASAFIYSFTRDGGYIGDLALSPNPASSTPDKSGSPT